MLEQLPEHLRAFAVEQRYEAYTPINQAVWRYVMRQNRHFLEHHAHDIYLEGLAASGIDVEEIPRLERMNACLARFGWGAVHVDGFIPPAVFMEFQAHRVLPIAIDIRTRDHIAYTPAPDIVHESAGHAPILLDPTFAEFVERITVLGAKAIASREDQALYEAIRHLSIVKEDPSATPEATQAAEAEFQLRQAAVTQVSEASLISRLYWWTVEYGLIGQLEAPRIYGAGLLSSVGESKRCLMPLVKKRPFDLDACLATPFDITSYQPQLFVCETFEQLLDAIRRFEPRMASASGGTSGLEKAINSKSPVTVVYASGLRVEGTVESLRYDESGEAIYLKTAGPTTLGLEDAPLPGHGPENHREGFGAPIGRLSGEARALEDFDDADLERHGLVLGKATTLTFQSGLQVSGRVRDVRRHQSQIVLIGFSDCVVTYGDEALFLPEWGRFDMAVGHRIVSVYAGLGIQHSARPAKRRQHEVASWDARETTLQGLYARVRGLRERPGEGLTWALEGVLGKLDADYPEDWILRLEVLELMMAHGVLVTEQPRLRAALQALQANAEHRDLIAQGLAMIDEVANRVEA